MSDSTPMREHETSAPSLGDEDLIERACEASWAVARPYIAEHFRAGMDPGEYGSQPAEDKAITRLEIAAVLDLFRSTAMAEAVASARAEGVKEGLEAAAQNCEMRASVWRHHVGKPSETPCDAQIAGVFDTAAQAIRGLPAPPTLIPGGSSDV